MRFCVLGSGSKGNCTYIETGRTAVLIDAGFSGREIERRLAAIGVEISSLSALLITHEHGDHLKGAAVLSRRFRLPVFANGATFRAAGPALANLHEARAFETGAAFHFQDLAIHPFSVSHDAADPVGFLLRDQRHSLGYCTDTGRISKLLQHRLAGCHGLILESNHDPELLRNGPYPLALQQRVRSASGHLANEEAASFLQTLLHDRLQHVVLAHISETNNRPELIHQTLTATFGAVGTAPSFPGVSLGWQARPGEVVALNGSAG